MNDLKVLFYAIREKMYWTASMYYWYKMHAQIAILKINAYLKVAYWWIRVKIGI